MLVRASCASVASSLELAFLSLVGRSSQYAVRRITFFWSSESARRARRRPRGRFRPRRPPAPAQRPLSRTCRSAATGSRPASPPGHGRRPQPPCRARTGAAAASSAVRSEKPRDASSACWAGRSSPSCHALKNNLILDLSTALALARAARAPPRCGAASSPCPPPSRCPRSPPRPSLRARDGRRRFLAALPRARLPCLAGSARGSTSTYIAPMARRATEGSGRRRRRARECKAPSRISNLVCPAVQQVRQPKQFRLVLGSEARARRRASAALRRRPWAAARWRECAAPMPPAPFGWSTPACTARAA